MRFYSITALLLSLAIAVHAASTMEESMMGMSKTIRGNMPTGTPKPGVVGNKVHQNKTMMEHHHKSQCEKLEELEKLVMVASNTTKLTKLPAAEQTKIKALAANATAEIKMLESNATLASLCQKEKDCREFLRLEKLSTILNNATDVTKIETESSMHMKNKTWTTAEINAFKANVTAKLNMLMTNTTLVNECKGLTPAGTVTGAASATGKSIGMSYSTPILISPVATVVKSTTNAAVRLLDAARTGELALVVVFASFFI
jgi:hypothetical protein